MNHAHILFALALWVAPARVSEAQEAIISVQADQGLHRVSRRLAGACIKAEKFSFAGLKELLTQNLATNFCLLVRELVKRAPQAILNQGAQRIVAEPWGFAYYETRKAFQDETTWLLWRHYTDKTDEQTTLTKLQQ